ncbi:hypothetical protein BDZ97DRAFT_1751508 [Flammula alnicola]|nr:hypothetical protein BDZ97DRAFT_1751508 [Flammula alnicola]
MKAPRRPRGGPRTHADEPRWLVVAVARRMQTGWPTNTMNARRKSARRTGEVAYTAGLHRPPDAGARGRRLALWRLQTSTPQEQPPRSPRLTANPKHDADAVGARDDEDDGHRVTTPRVPEPAASYEWPRNANPTTDTGDTTIPLLHPPGPIDLGFDDTSPPPITTNPRRPRRT